MSSLQIFAVDESYQVALVFTKSKSYVEANLKKIIGKLMAATLAAVEIASIGDDEAEPSRASVTTVVVAYFIYSNGTVLTSTQVEKMISVPQHSLGLIELGLADIVSRVLPSSTFLKKHYSLIAGRRFP
ncbi:Cadherin-related family member 2 [Liparis tanakae]|uniref:Cadherin-related family member 2 n=1 Tax=Liparis tanakae TaxID=230148 RepID=A0A4Z2EAY7_9TELE|nr:Cadherin-related family member 2 [Liparis tanakae]